MREGGLKWCQKILTEKWRSRGCIWLMKTEVMQSQQSFRRAKQKSSFSFTFTQTLCSLKCGVMINTPSAEGLNALTFNQGTQDYFCALCAAWMLIDVRTSMCEKNGIDKCDVIMGT